MRLFLASYRLGTDSGALTRLCAPPCRVGVIANAADGWPSAARDWAVTSEFTMLRPLGYEPEEIDLRAFIGAPNETVEHLRTYPLIWVRGGNTFVLRARMAQSGADAALQELVGTGAVAYGGYSAGACILSPSLRGLELFDDPAEVPLVCAATPIWEGLGIVTFQIVPHYQSEGHEHPERVDELVHSYTREGVDFRTLRDSEVLTIVTG
ncbi:Type 1 glutamine amidotransferase-like domain-containing protein [Hoyosella subflava]|uniref:Type 1 glutamine amidotransferase-like domain-containing protein n=1 Tax=Hoyosella subflava TaxID=639313 RepID=UPI00059B85E5|nr:Type 1 glutamine amidotransferase-like domain-containing protein [Hoyosella subflava]